MMRFPNLKIPTIKDTQLIIFTDGSIRPEKGRSGLGVIVKNPQGEVLHFWSQPAGALTNNEAEYEAVIMALERLIRLTSRWKRRALTLLVYTDSQIVVEQMRGSAMTNAPALRSCQARLRRLVIEFGQVIFRHIPREENRLADALANDAADQPLHG